jgi:hypothetical protein
LSTTARDSAMVDEVISVSPRREKDSANYFRLKRARIFGQMIDRVIAEKGSATVLDIGGTLKYWQALPSLWRNRPVQITITNLIGRQGGNDQIRFAVGDARNLVEFSDTAFDVVHSNSVIEHVGHWDDQTRMASEVRRLGRCYYLQTPNVYFPIEPHYKLPALHWLPESWRAEGLRHIKGQLPPNATFDQAMRRVQGINLLTAHQLRSLFPDARIIRERILGITKSLIAINAPF